MRAVPLSHTLTHPHSAHTSIHSLTRATCDDAVMCSPGWLNDKVVSFAMEYFGRDEFGARLASAAFLPAPIVQMVSLIDSPAELGLILADLKLGEKGTIFLPLNDHDDPMQRGGSHWALLVYHARTWALYDSITTVGQSTMEDKATWVANRFAAAFGLAAPTAAVSTPKCAQQVNGFDCGVYAVAFAHSIATAIVDSEKVHDQGVATITPGDISQWRDRLYTTITKLCDT